MPSYAERRKRIDAVDKEISKYPDIPENKKKRKELDDKLTALLELPKWWESTLFFHEDEEQSHKKNTTFVHLVNYKAPTTPHIKVIVKWTNLRHLGGCCGAYRFLPIQRHILAAALPLTQPDGSPWDFEKHDEFIPRWQECGDYCGCCGLNDKIELLHWKLVISTRY